MWLSLFVIVPPPVPSRCFALSPLWLSDCSANTHTVFLLLGPISASPSPLPVTSMPLPERGWMLIGSSWLAGQLWRVKWWWGGAHMERGNKTETRKSDWLWKCNYSPPTCMEVITVIYLSKFTVIVLVNWDLWLTLFDILCHERSLILSPSHWACHPLIHSLFVSCLLLEPAPALSSFQLQRQLFMHRAQGENILFFSLFISLFIVVVVERPQTRLKNVISSWRYIYVTIARKENANLLPTPTV